MWRRCLKETIYYLHQRNWEHNNQLRLGNRYRCSGWAVQLLNTVHSSINLILARDTVDKGEALPLIRRRENRWKRWRTSFCSSLPGDVLMLRRGSQRLHQVYAAQVLLRGIQRLVWHGKMEGSFGLDERWVSVLAIPMVQKNKKFWVKSFIYWRMAGRLLQ